METLTSDGISLGTDLFLSRFMTIIVTSGKKNPPKKLVFSQFLPRFQALPLLFLRNSYLLTNLITIFGNIVWQLVSADLSGGKGNYI